MQYTVKEFRESMRKALNEIDAGGRVTIERYGKIYQLLPTDLREIEISGIKVVKLEDKVRNMEVDKAQVQSKLPVIRTPKQAKEISVKDDFKICPHGYPANGWSCKKGCK